MSILVVIVSAIDLAMTAYRKTTCLNSNSGDPSGFGKAASVINYDDCFQAIMKGDQRQRRDGAVAMLALGMAIATAVIQSKAHRRARS